MAFAASMQWDVRTTGSNSNGGGFDPTSGTPGTNYAQQDSPQVTYTDLVIDGSTNTKCTSAGHPFTSAHVGNVINVTGGTGFTVQRVQVMSVTGSTATCDKSLGTLSSTGGTGNLGGGLLTIATANGLLVAPSGANSNVVNIKAGTYTHTTTTTITVSSKWVGYSSTWADQVAVFPLSSRTQPLITTATNSIELFNHSGGNIDVEMSNLHLSNTAGTRASGIVPVSGHNTTNPVFFIGCIFDGFTVAINGDNAGAHYDWSYVVVVNCEIKNSTQTGAGNGGITLNSNTLWLQNSLIRDGAGAGIAGVANLHAYNSIIARNTQSGYSHGSINGLTESISCNWVGNGASGINIGNSGTPSNVVLITVNSIYYGNTGYGIANAGSTNYVGYQADAGACNAFGGNTTAARQSWLPCPGDVTLTADPFTNSAGNDFSLNGTAGGGAACKAAGIQWS